MTEAGVIDAMNMIILPRECPNNTPDRNTNDAEDSLLRMTVTDQAYTLDYTDGEDFDMDLNM